MAGRTNRIPRCPVCGAMLSTDRTIDERWVRRHPDPDLWVYRLACAQCLSIARVEVPEVSAIARSEASRAVVDVAGGVTARLLERVEKAAGLDEIVAAIADAAADAEHRVLLRIPEVLARVRSAYAPRVRLREPLVVDWPGARDSTRPSGRLVLHLPRSRDPDAIVGGLEMRLPAGTELPLLGVEGGQLLLEPPRGESEAAEWLAAVVELVVWPDEVEPIAREGG